MSSSSGNHPQGVNAAFLRDHVLVKLRDVCGNDASELTTTDVCGLFVKKMTMSSQTSYIEHMAQHDPDAYGMYVGTPTVFVSHAWRYTFTTLVETILAYEAAEAPGAYFWIDLFPNNQHKASTLPHEW